MFSPLSSPRNLHSKSSDQRFSKEGMREQQEGADVQGLGSQALRVAAKLAGRQCTVPQCPGRWGEQGAVTVARDRQQDRRTQGDEAGPRQSWEVKSVGQGWVQGHSWLGTGVQGYLQHSSSQVQAGTVPHKASPSCCSCSSAPSNLGAHLHHVRVG